MVQPKAAAEYHMFSLLFKLACIISGKEPEGGGENTSKKWQACNPSMNMSTEGQICSPLGISGKIFRIVRQQNREHSFLAAA